MYVLEWKLIRYKQLYDNKNSEIHMIWSVLGTTNFHYNNLQCPLTVVLKNFLKITKDFYVKIN